MKNMGAVTAEIPKVSIVVPVYNTDLNLLDQCIRSILNQSFGDFELLLIDDGSKKACAAALDEYMHNDGRIVVYHQENGGVSVARNRGLVLAKGEYITFVDSDDAVAPDFLQRYLRYMEAYNLDMVIGGREELYENGKRRTIPVSTCEAECFLLECREKLAEMLLTDHILGVPELHNCICEPWGRIIKSDLAKKAVFPVGIKIGEDLLYNLCLCNYVSRVGFIKENLYYYRIVAESAMRKPRNDEVERIQGFLLQAEAFVKEFYPQKVHAYYMCVILRYGYIIQKQKFLSGCACKRIAAIHPFAEAFRNIDVSKVLLKQRHKLVILFARYKMWDLISVMFGVNYIKTRLFECLF